MGINTSAYQRIDAVLLPSVRRKQREIVLQEHFWMFLVSFGYSYMIYRIKPSENDLKNSPYYQESMGALLDQGWTKEEAHKWHKETRNHTIGFQAPWNGYYSAFQKVFGTGKKKKHLKKQKKF